MLYRLLLEQKIIFSFRLHVKLHIGVNVHAVEKINCALDTLKNSKNKQRQRVVCMFISALNVKGYFYCNTKEIVINLHSLLNHLTLMDEYRDGICEN